MYFNNIIHKVRRFLARNREDERIKRVVEEHSKNQINVSENDTFPHVNWISYHIPKTAGTSLRNALETALGKNAVFGSYKATSARIITKGDPIWVNDQVKVLHGHFAARLRHLVNYPNARRMVWIRDPLERAWSSVHFWARMENNQHHKTLIKLFGQIPDSKEELFIGVLNDRKLRENLMVYSQFLSELSPEDFAFIGDTKFFSEDLGRLSNLMGVDLPFLNVNTAPRKKQVRDLSVYRPYFKSEYEVYDRYFEQRCLQSQED